MIEIHYEWLSVYPREIPHTFPTSSSYKYCTLLVRCTLTTTAVSVSFKFESTFARALVATDGVLAHVITPSIVSLTLVDIWNKSEINMMLSNYFFLLFS